MPLFFFTAVMLFSTQHRILRRIHTMCFEKNPTPETPSPTSYRSGISQTRLASYFYRFIKTNDSSYIQEVKKKKLTSSTDPFWTTYAARNRYFRRGACALNVTRVSWFTLQVKGKVSELLETFFFLLSRLSFSSFLR